MSFQALDMWVIYDHPSDFPDTFVARRWEVRAEERATDDIKKHESLDALRGLIINETRCHHRLARFADDDSKIVEVWL